MNNRGLTLILTVFLILCAFSFVLTVIPENVRGTTFYVGGIGPGNFTRIQDAIDAARPGDTVFVYSGTYYEHINVSKTLNLKGENRDTTIVNGSGGGDVVNVTASWVSMEGFNVTNSGLDYLRSGIRLWRAYGCRITNNNIAINNYHGIGVWFSSHNVIMSNNAWDNLKGIFLSHSDSNILIGNNVSSNDWYGIYSWYSNDNIIVYNNASSNGWAGILISHSGSNIIAKNIASLNDVGIQLPCSTNNTIVNNTVTFNFHVGITLYTLSDNNNVVDNDVLSNYFDGISLSSADSNIISNNTVVGNHDGLYITSGSNNNTVTYNNISLSKYYGVILWSCDNNTIHHNRFVDNGVQAFDNGEYILDYGYPTGGNHWSDYSGADFLNGPSQDQPGPDGIGDTPYAIDTDSQDRYPLLSLDVKDEFPPIVVIVSPIDGENFDYPHILVTGLSFDPGGSGIRNVDLRLNEGAWTYASGTSFWNTTISLDPGLNVVEARAWDNVGHSSEISSVNVYYSPTPTPNHPPTASFILAPSTGNVATNFTVDASSSSDLEDSVGDLEVRWDWEDDGNWDTTWSTAKAVQHQYSIPGNYIIRLEIRDTGGLTNHTTKNVFVIPLENLPPTCTIDDPTPGDTLSGNFLIRGEAYDSDGAVEIVEIRIDNENWTQAIGSTTWAYDWDTTTFGNREHIIHARSFDGADYSSEVSVTVNVENAPSQEQVGIWLWVLTGVIVVIVVVILLVVLWVVRRRKRREEELTDESSEEQFEN
jgi:parallel beta-helix repeat protein